MCCQYKLGLEEYFNKRAEKTKGQEAFIEYTKNKIIYPNKTSPVITLKNGIQEVTLKKWGFKSFDGKPIINAREETIREKAMFKGYEKHRCVIPIVGFFEWSKDGVHTKYYFSFRDNTIYYLVCIYDVFDNFVVITRTPNDEMINIHDRMPLLLKEEEIINYLSNKLDIKDIKNMMDMNLVIDKA